MSFDLTATLRRILSDHSGAELFPFVFQEIERYHGRVVASIGDLKARDNKKLKGDLWEAFCYLYLSHLSNYDSLKYKIVWFWKEIPADFLISIGLRPTKVDNGIDLVAITQDNQYHAIQCKYLGDQSKTVTWTTLSTFVGLCQVSGPWAAHYVMTTGRGITRKVPRTDKDHTLAKGTFNAISRDMWMKMAGTYHTAQIGYRLSDPISSNDTDITNVTESLQSFDLEDLEAPIDPQELEQKRQQEELRQKRLQYYSSSNK